VRRFTGSRAHLTPVQFLSRNSGSSNAFTGSTNTNYYFNVATSALAGALERFSGFFHSPLFAPSGTIRELNAVDSEHKKNLQNDKWRASQLNKHLTKPGHVWSKFGSGNKVSLTSAARKLTEDGAKKKDTDGSSSFQDTGKRPSLSLSPSPSSTPSPESSDDGGPIGRETRRRLVEWWSREYCAGRMRLCVVGKGEILCPAVTSASLMQTWKIRWTNWPIWPPIYSRPYQIVVRFLYPRFRITLLALTKKVYVLSLPRISVTGYIYYDDRPWSPFRP
jgi:secreted Zn-dependent insulinase-like peptidase